MVTPVAAAVDLYPTLMELAGIDRVGDRPFDGISLAPWLLGEGGDAPDRVLFHHWAGRTSARDQRYRLDAAGALFDLGRTPGRRRTSPPITRGLKRLAEAVARWKRDVLAELPRPTTGLSRSASRPSRGPCCPLATASPTAA